MAPLVKEFKKHKNKILTKVCITAQHREMLDQVLDFFDLKADYDLNLMKPNQNLFSLTSEIINSLRKVLEDFNPQYVFVHGDTTTTMAASIASFYYGTKICHVEAGLRTYKKNSPFPEEINRQITSRICDFHFAPTKTSMKNLIKENIDRNSILVTGNTVIDALFDSLEKIKQNPSQIVNNLKSIFEEKEVILITAHRRENFGKSFENICRAIKRIAENDKNRIVIYPVHLNPNVKEMANKFLCGVENIVLTDPLKYQDFVWLMHRSKIILTDSGGIQEEAPSLGKPVLVMRETTERPEAIKRGTVILVGTCENKIVDETLELLNDDVKYKKMSMLHNPYGDGLASKRIVNFINKYI